jgi:uncharacterized phage protein gp47/JayE
MAYEHMTYESILGRMMERVKADYPNIDTREGSILFNALAPAAIELAIMYTELDNIFEQSFVTTASRGYLLLGCQEMGMNVAQFYASQGVHKGVFNVEVPIFSRWNHDLYNYFVDEYIGVNEEGNHEYRLICETSGTEPNNTAGDLIPITDAPNNLTLARITECLIEGENETSDDDIRQAYYDYVNGVAVDGNVKQYEKWCAEYNGIGNYRIVPLWNGQNTVKVSILSASNRAASPELVAEFQEYLDPNSDGMGNGVAPIGAIVTVTTADERDISVSANVIMKSGYSDTTPINNALSNYLGSIAYKKRTVTYLNVGATILGVEGVDSITDLKINGGTTDIVLGEDEIPVLDECIWTVM